MIKAESGLPPRQQRKNDAYYLSRVAGWVRQRDERGTTIGEAASLEGLDGWENTQATLERLEASGLVITHVDERGRKRFVISDDYPNRRALDDIVDAYGHELRQKYADKRRPQTPYYVVGIRTVRKAERKHDSFGIPIDEKIAQEAEDNLKLGREVEELVDEGLEGVQAKYDAVLKRLERLRTGNH